MIWVIGDIHGMFDPLKRILTEIRLVEAETGEPVERIVFVGDYVDHGPSSKEVLDLVRKPVFPTVALMGNHEDMTVRMMKPDPDYVNNYGEMWMINGAAETCLSIIDRPGDQFVSLANQLGIKTARQLSSTRDAIGLPAKYVRFLSSLRYTHREVIEVGGRPVAFTFMHSLPNPALPVGDQLVGNYAAFNRHLAALRPALPPDQAPLSWEPNAACLEHSLIWGRSYDFDKGYGGSVIVHGHTPTLYYKNIYGSRPQRGHEPLWDQFAHFPQDSLTPFFFSRSPGARLDKAPPPSPPPAALTADPIRRGWWDRDGHFLYETGGDLGIEAINVDTAAVMGGALTALGLSARYLEEGYLVFLSCPSSGNRRQATTKVHRRSVRFNRLGGPDGASADRTP